MEHVEIALSVNREERWCALGVADITAFKALNDTLGHTAGDRVLERIADLLRSEVRSSDLLGYQPDAERPPALHARFGGDEFCFFLSDLDDAEVACAIGERFWYAVAEYDWVTEDLRVATPKVTRGYSASRVYSSGGSATVNSMRELSRGTSVRGRTAGSMK